MIRTERLSPVENEAGVATAPPEHLSAARLLAVDDEPAACRLLSLILAARSFRCTTASSGEEAVVALQREHFDAVISDLHMPGMSGMELLAEVRRRHPHTAFLVTTGVDDVDVGVQAMRSGADDYLVKPLRDTAVVASLERALHKGELEQQIKNYHQHLEEMVVERTSQLQNALQQVGDWCIRSSESLQRGWKPARNSSFCGARGARRDRGIISVVQLWPSE